MDVTDLDENNGDLAENESGYLVHARVASKGRKYTCPCCRRRVIPKQGTKLRHHFAHHAQNKTKCHGYSRGESAVHSEAKWFIAENVQDFRFVMQSCDASHCQTVNKQNCIRFDRVMWNVEVEGKIKDTGTTSSSGGASRRRRADVLLSPKPPVDNARLEVFKKSYSIEVFASHAVSVLKTTELHKAGCGIIEIPATVIMGFKKQTKRWGLHTLLRVQ